MQWRRLNPGFFHLWAIFTLRGAFFRTGRFSLQLMERVPDLVGINLQPNKRNEQIINTKTWEKLCKFFLIFESQQIWDIIGINIGSNVS